MVNPTTEQSVSLARYYKQLLEKAAENRQQHGVGSQQYAVAVCVLSATASAVQAAFLFPTVTEAHRWLRGIALFA